ncbi:MAG: aldolase/citrate lyase family protein [Gammaproteobacteria bacterium]
MPEIINHAKQRLQNGQLTVGFGVSRLRTPEIATIAKACGFHWLFIDMEHSTVDVDRAAEICAAALPTGVTPLVRVPGMQHFHMTRVLDGGALGVVVPHVDTAEQARAIVAACKYPPAGHRSLMGALPQLGYANVPIPQAIEQINAALLIVVMLESPQAIANADEIAAVPGIDVLLIGSNDLAAESGVPGQVGHERIEAAYGQVIAAARKHGKHPGMGGVYEHKLMEKYIRMGVRFVLGGADLGFILAGARSRTEFLRGIVPD